MVACRVVLYLYYVITVYSVYGEINNDDDDDDDDVPLTRKGKAYNDQTYSRSYRRRA